MSIPSPIYLYRIIHISNLEYILSHNLLTSPNHEAADPNYEGIGDNSLIEYRNAARIPIAPGGTFRDYVSFYFGKRSPMLYNISHGFNEVRKRNQENIIYLVTTFENIVETGLRYVYFDGHGYHRLSQLFNSEHGLINIDWKTINADRWNDTEDDPDRKRRKQAEFLVYQAVPLGIINFLVTFNDNAKNMVIELLINFDHTIQVAVRPNWYY
jgi:hypothetical protein